MDHQRGPATVSPATTRILPARYRGRFQDRPVAALVCAGPSLESVDLEAVRASGATIIVLNRAYEWAPRPHAWIGFDKPSEFAATLWHDAAVPKFTHAQNRFNAMPKNPHQPHGNLYRAATAPNTAWLPVQERLPVQRYWTAPTLGWGLTAPGVDLPEYRLTFLSCFRIAWELGIHSLFLLGVDWHTTPEKSYAGDRCHPKAHCESLNRRFTAYGTLLAELIPGFLARGLEVHNANPTSQLSVFPAASVDALIAAARDRNQSGAAS